MENTSLIESGQIEVSKKTLLHISEGIYRTEGSALKELINNSFDANAKKVIVTTNYPQFDIITIQDDGNGMTEEEFLRIVKGGIGDSPKANLTSELRPLIGRLGIGILSVAQICRSFTIISHNEKTKTAFKGRMIFRTDIDEEAKKDSKSSYEIGVWELEERPSYDPSKKGVLIFTKDLRQSFLKRFRESEAILNHEKNIAPTDFDKLLEMYYDNSYRMVKEQGPYYELIWELCNLLPLQYLDRTPVRDEVKDKIFTSQSQNLGKSFQSALDFIEKKNHQLTSFDFTVIFDNIKLFRPIKLPSPLINKEGIVQDTHIFYFEYNNIVRKRRLKCFGYFLSQEMAIKPRDLKGLQIRIKNVGIGPHDPTFLKYDKIESPRDNWLTGEIYVEEGLESALNIDRDSFNENDEHYYILKEQVHKFLGEVVFPTISNFQRKRNKSKRDKKYDETLMLFKADLKSFFQKYFFEYKIEFNETNVINFDKESMRIFIPQALLTSNNKIKMEIFSGSAIAFLDFLRSNIKDSTRVESAFKEISQIILA